jgi:hypothetical protein
MGQTERKGKGYTWIHGLPMCWGDHAVSYSKQVTRHPKFYQGENVKVSRKIVLLFFFPHVD